MHPQQTTFTARCFASVIDYPILCCILFVVITAFSIGGYVYPTWPGDLRAWWRAEHESTKPQPDQRISRSEAQRRNRIKRIGSNETESLGRVNAVVVVRSSQIFTSDGASAFRSVVKALQDLDVVANARSLDQAPPLNIFGLAEPILPKGHATPQRFAAAKAKAVKHPMIVGQLLSPDAETALIEISYDWIYIQEESDCTEKLLAAARAAAANYPSVSMDFSITGSVPIQLVLAANNRSNEMKYQLIGYGMILTMAAILFRGLTVVIVLAAAPIIGVLWTLGILRYFDWHDNPFSFVILPVLLSLVGFTDGVHMMIHIRKIMQSGKAPRIACKQTLELVGLACFLTSLTTAIGMGSLAFAHHEVVREFGWSCVIGVAATWISVMIVIPLVCCTPWSKRFARSSGPDFLDKSLDRLGPMIRTVIVHARWVSITAIVLMLALTGVSLTLKPDDRRSSSLPSGSEAQKTLAYVDQAMGGTDVCSIQLNFDPDKYNDESVVSMLMRIDRTLSAEPLIHHPLSLYRLLEALPGDGDVMEKVSMIELLPPPLKQALYSPESGQATVVFRCQDLGTAAYKETFERIDKSLEEISAENSNVRLFLNGEAVWRWRNLYKIVTDLTASLSTASIIIFAVMGFAYRSLRIGLISVIPNLLPLAASASWLVVSGQPLEIVSVCCFTICLGIAVDDTIHFLSRYQEELKFTSDHLQAIERSFQGVGIGMVMTTVVLVAGFSSVLISETRDHRVFGALGAITLITALLCDLFILPALLAFFDRPPAKEASKQ